MQFHSYNLSFNKSTTDSNSCIFCSNRLLKLKNSKIRIIITEGGPVNNLRQSICRTFRKRRSDAGQRALQQDLKNSAYAAILLKNWTQHAFKIRLHSSIMLKKNSVTAPWRISTVE